MSRFSAPRTYILSRYGATGRPAHYRRAGMGDLTTLLTESAGLSGLPEAPPPPSDLQGLKRLLKKVKKVVKKVAPIAAVVAGAVFLGPIAGKVVSTVAGKIGSKSSGGEGIPEPEGKPTVPVDSGPPAWQSALNSVLGIVQSQRVIEAVQRGDVPPPPVSLQGDSFTQWATSIANLLAQQELQRKLDANEQAALNAQVRQIQNAAAAQVPSNVIYSPMPEVPVAIQQAQEASFITGNQVNTMILAGGAVLLALLAFRR